jgi:hypothetical protein
MAPQAAPGSLFARNREVTESPANAPGFPLLRIQYAKVNGPGGGA